jgi:hypothetical protein
MCTHSNWKQKLMLTVQGTDECISSLNILSPIHYTGHDVLNQYFQQGAQRKHKNLLCV